MLTFNKNYFFLFAGLFLTETVIAMYVHDSIVRPFLGDVLVVILVYSFVKSFIKLPVITAAIAVLLFAFVVEFLQYLNIVATFQLKNKIVKTVLGTSFSWMDMLCYVIGIIVVVAIEKRRTKPN